MSLTYTGRDFCVKVGTRFVRPGETLAVHGSEAVHNVDAESLERLAKRSDFQGEAKSAPKPKKKTTEVKADG